MISKDVNGNQYEITAKVLTWRPSTYGVVVSENKILLIKENGKYHLPGGGVELGEDPALAVLREIKEETGVTAKNPKLLSIASSFFSFGADDNPPNLQHVQSLLVYYSCEYMSMDSDDIQLDEYEALTDMTAEWIEVSMLQNITVGTTVDWRSVVRQATR